MHGKFLCIVHFLYMTIHELLTHNSRVQKAVRKKKSQNKIKEIKKPSEKRITYHKWQQVFYPDFKTVSVLKMQVSGSFTCEEHKSWALPLPV